MHLSTIINANIALIEIKTNMKGTGLKSVVTVYASRAYSNSND